MDGKLTVELKLKHSVGPFGLEDWLLHVRLARRVRIERGHPARRIVIHPEAMMRLMGTPFNEQPLLGFDSALYAVNPPRAATLFGMVIEEDKTLGFWGFVLLP